MTKLQNVKLRDGKELWVGDEVYTNWNPKCDGLVFIVFEITDWPYCESGARVNVHLKGERDKVVKTTDGKGLDANWFRPVKKSS